jgi:uncharacterized phiE125 gp8 family phage protein
MWYPATVTTEPETEPVTLAQAKAQCVGAGTSDNATLERLIASERAFVEKYCGIKIVTQTLKLKCDLFANFERVPAAPIQSVTSITYTDADGATQTLDPAIYEVRADGLDAAIVLNFGQSWPAIRRGSRITVIVVAGFVDTQPDLVSAILLRIGNAFYLSKRDPALRLESIDGVIRRDWDNTGAMDKVFRQAVTDLLENYRCWMAL